jgi:hypothetical protein
MGFSRFVVQMLSTPGAIELSARGWVFGRDKRNDLGSGGRLSGIVAMHPDYKDAFEVLVKAARPLPT